MMEFCNLVVTMALGWIGARGEICRGRQLRCTCKFREGRGREEKAKKYKDQRIKERGVYFT